MNIEYELKYDDIRQFIKELKNIGFGFRKKLKYVPKTVLEGIFSLLFFVFCSYILIKDIIVSSYFITIDAIYFLFLIAAIYFLFFAIFLIYNRIHFIPRILSAIIMPTVYSVNISEENINIICKNKNKSYYKSFYYTQVAGIIKTDNFLSVIFKDDKLEKCLLIPKKILNDEVLIELDNICHMHFKNKKTINKIIDYGYGIIGKIIFLLMVAIVTYAANIDKIIFETPQINLIIGNKNIQLHKGIDTKSDEKLQIVNSVLQNEKLNFADKNIDFILKFDNVKEKYGKNYDSVAFVLGDRHFIHIDNKYKDASINALASQIAARSIGIDADISLNERIYSCLIEAYVWKYLNQNNKDNISDNEYITNIDKYMNSKENFWNTLEEREKFLNALVITSLNDGKNLIEYASSGPQFSNLKKESKNFKNKEFEEKFHKLLNLYNSI